jgi:hypothetical protein
MSPEPANFTSRQGHQGHRSPIGEPNLCFLHLLAKMNEACKRSWSFKGRTGKLRVGSKPCHAGSSKGTSSVLRLLYGENSPLDAPRQGPTIWNRVILSHGFLMRLQPFQLVGMRATWRQLPPPQVPFCRHSRP